jgi:prespore-specific regulator
MTILRQDAWTKEEDALLAEVTLRHIREGSTQLVAFEEVGEKLSRTPAACGFRWNSLIRKQYEGDIVQAKKERKERNKRKGKKTEISNDPNYTYIAYQEGIQRSEQPLDLSIDDIISFLKQMQSASPTVKNLESENKILISKIQEYKKENGLLKTKLELINKEYESVCGDYKALLQIMDRARKLAEVPVRN